jgi:hypothetical protein
MAFEVFDFALRPDSGELLVVGEGDYMGKVLSFGLRSGTRLPG